MAIEVNIDLVFGGLCGNKGHLIVASIYLQGLRVEGAAALCDIHLGVPPATPRCIHHKSEGFAGV